MQKIPIGISDFKKLRENNFFYVDKTLFIKEIIEASAEIILITRPRRFGKTLNLSTLRYYFEKTALSNVSLFKGLAILNQGEEYTQKQGRYPVIFLTFKDVKERTWNNCYCKLKDLIQEEYLRHKYLIKGDCLEAQEKLYFEAIINLTSSPSDYENSLKNLTKYLERYHQQKVVLLIDEYDTPIQAGYLNDYYEDNISFIRNLLSAALKDNASIEKGVLTGILRIAKESIFSGLNNLGVFTILNRPFSDKFGLTEDEVTQAFSDYKLDSKRSGAGEWYNGYRFGKTTIYNPWSILNFMDNPEEGLIPYWVNTADNALIEKLLTNNNQLLKPEMEALISGKAVTKKIEENIIYSEVGQKEDVIWSFLLFSGYLKFVNEWTINEGETRLYDLAIPNREVRMMYRTFVERWFVERINNDNQRFMLKALTEGDIELFETIFQETILKIFSYHDFGQESEKVYQAFVIGLLVWLSDTHELRSNRESGYGRYDVMLIPKDRTKLGIIMEFKKVNTRKHETMEQAIAVAFKQIEDKQYASELQSLGVTQILKLAIIFNGKEVKVEEL